MKKILAILLITFFAIFTACGQTSYNIPNGTLLWDAPLDIDGNPIPAVELSYEVFTADYPVVDPQDVGAFTLIGTNVNELLAFTVDTKKKQVLGVRVIRVYDGETLTSLIAWSYILEDVDPVKGTFTVRYIPIPGKVKNIRTQ